MCNLRLCVHFTGAKPKGGQNESTFGDLITTADAQPVHCYCSVVDQKAVKEGRKIVPAGHVTATDIAKANFREYEGLLVCPPHNTRVPGETKCQCVLYPSKAGLEQLPDHLQDSRLWVALKTLQNAKGKGSLDEKVDEVLGNAI